MEQSLIGRMKIIFDIADYFFFREQAGELLVIILREKKE
jgi:hypothetical protein